VAEPHPRTVPSSEATEAPPVSEATEALGASVTVTNPQLAEPYVQPSEPPAPPQRSRRGLILVGCALLGIVIGVAVDQLTSSGAIQARTAPRPSPTASATAVPAKVDPVSANGTNFRSKAGVWESQSYASQSFGGLKKGIGLRLDLGQARPLHAVDFTALDGPITVELRAGDQPSADGEDFRLVGAPMQANGPTSLPARTGGSHRYWTIWVTKLSPALKAKIAEPGARG
jgi:hypothetical protein